MSGNSETTTTSHATWYDSTTGSVPEALHLVIVWASTLGRLAESACVDQKVILGRGGPRSEDMAPRLVWQQQRPLENRPRPPLDQARISRTQLVLQPKGDLLEVSCVGRCPLFHNARPVQIASVKDGDLLTLADALTLLVERRPKVFAPLPIVQPHARFDFGAPDPYGVVGESNAIWKQRASVARLASQTDPVLVLGDSGSGKELAAKALHGLSARRDKHLVARNAATLPPSLVDAELFGNFKNYPNAGSPERPGLIGQAHGGTLFLDELGELPLEQQAHLLRFLDHGEYQRLGEAKVRRAEVGFVGATNRKPEELKHDLLARFTHRLRVPGLQERRTDIPLLIDQVVREAAKAVPDYQRFLDADARPATCRLHPQLAERLVLHEYTHHYRELARLIHIAMESSSGNHLQPSKLLEEELKLEECSEARPDLGREDIERALSQHGGNVSKAAQALSLSSRYVLYRLMKQYGITGRAK